MKKHTPHSHTRKRTQLSPARVTVQAGSHTPSQAAPSLQEPQSRKDRTLAVLEDIRNQLRKDIENINIQVARLDLISDFVRVWGEPKEKDSAPEPGPRNYIA